MSLLLVCDRYVALVPIMVQEDSAYSFQCDGHVDIFGFVRLIIIHQENKMVLDDFFNQRQ